MDSGVTKSLSNILILVLWISVAGSVYSPISEQLDVDTETRSLRSRAVDVRDDGSQPKPCCLPYRFQAIIASLPTFSAQDKQVTHLYRDWENQLQIQETVTFSKDGIQASIQKFIMDYTTMVQYVVAGGTCQKGPIDSGMLEPCMPENSQYLGKSYIGQYDNQAHFDAWYFKRTDKNRNIEMIIAVTSDRCVPISEHITGTLGSSQVDALVLFTNLTEEVPDSAFTIPSICLDSGPM